MFGKKIVIVCIAACVLLAASVAATASETDWIILMRASSTAYTNACANLQLGSVGTAVNGKGVEDVMTNMRASTVAYIASYRPTFPDTPPFYSTDKIGLINANNPGYSWDLRLWANTNYSPASVRLAVWTLAIKDLPTSFSGTPYQYTLEVYDDPTGEHTGFKKVWTDGIAVGTSTAPTFYLDWTSFPKLSPAEAVDGGIKLRMTVAPVPEPSSMLALVSGLSGMAAFMWRKKK